MRLLEFWCEFASTYSFPAAMRIGRLAEEAGVGIVWRPFHDSSFNIFSAKGRYMWRDLVRVCAAEGLPLRLPPVRFPQNGLKAARLALVGEAGRGFTSLHLTVVGQRNPKPAAFAGIERPH